MKLTKKEEVLLALLSQLGPYPDRSEKVYRTKIQIKINRLLANDIQEVLNGKEKLLFKALIEYWREDKLKKKQIMKLVLKFNLTDMIKKAIEKKKIL